MRWLALLLTLPLSAQVYDLVVRNARVIDPDSRLDAVRHIGVTGAAIRSVSAQPLRGKVVVDATGLVAAPGFIDLHSHGQDEENYRFKAMDGVTTALEMEVGVADIDEFYKEREGKALIHFGATIGHIPLRMRLMKDPGAFLPTGPAATRAATDAEIAELRKQIAHGLARGAPGVGFGINYTAAATYWEILEMFRAAAQARAACYVHLRGMGPLEPGAVVAASEALAASAITGAGLHIVHANSTGLRAAAQLLQLVREARGQGRDVTTECYPYTATQTDIASAIYADGWQQKMGITFGDLQWVETGERLTAATFARYRKQGGMVIAHSMPEEMIRMAVADPLTMIASDGGLRGGKGHPRSAGTFARILGRYVREQKALSLVEAIAKMSLLPARRLEARVPMMKNKGRIQPGADADIVLFDPATVTDRATFDKPAQFSEGFRHVLVNGVAVVKDGKLVDGVYPGKGVRAPLK
jgi:N-acyl-D-aspartate/D-glutamate deacylase